MTSENSTAEAIANQALKNLDVKDQDDGDVVDPWNVASTSETGVNYDKLIGKEQNIYTRNANPKL